MPQRVRVLQRAQMTLGMQAGASKSAGTAKRASTAGRVGSAKSVSNPGRGVPHRLLSLQLPRPGMRWLQVQGALAGIKKKGCKSARTSRKKRGGRVSLLACRQYLRGTSAKEDAIRIGVVSIRNHPLLDCSPPLLPLHNPPPHPWLEN